MLNPIQTNSIAVGEVSPLHRFGFPRRESAELSQSTLMLGAIGATGKHLYQGTVPAHVKARRRAANKVARIARRAARR